MDKVEHNADVQPALKDLVFELSELGQAKFCIAVCDDLSWRENLTKSIEAQLNLQGIGTLLIKPKGVITDLVELIRQRAKSSKSQVAIVDGLDEFEEESLNITLSYLNFKRDILYSLQVPILFWVSNSVLNKVVARAPDFWSRRTVTQYFSAAPVQALVRSLFAEEAKRDPNLQTDGKVFQALRRVISHERVLEQLTQHSKQAPPLELDRLMSEIQLGIDELISECHLSNKIEVTFRLWVLAEVDTWLKQVARNISAQLGALFKDLYEERMDILLKLADKMPLILENYKNNLVSRVREGRKVNLLGYFDSYVDAETNRMFKEVARDDYIHHRTQPNDFEELVKEDKRLQGSITDEIQERATKELLDWIHCRIDRPPEIFNDDEGKLLRLLYQGKRKPSRIARSLGIKEKEAREIIEKLRSKVLLFLGVNPW